jgi:3-deoxy-manno-octulosonate cytidylyltransferase (CMP-KDO synthetase)
VPPAAPTGSRPSVPRAPQVLVVIPARYASTRFPGKPLADLAGRPMIEHVYRRASAASGVDAVLVATDDDRIAAAVTAFGGEVVMTRPSHASGTDRIAEAIAPRACDIVVNVQGDEPLIDPAMIGELLAPLRADPAVRMSTLRREIADDAEYASPHVVKVVVDRLGDALYFSRAPIPCARDVRDRLAYRHIGVYAYRRDLLLWLAAQPRTPLETAESLEQLRALEHGIRIRTVPTRYDAIGVDTPEELERVRRRLQDITPAAARAHEVA